MSIENARGNLVGRTGLLLLLFAGCVAVLAALFLFREIKIPAPQRIVLEPNRDAISVEVETTLADRYLGTPVKSREGDYVGEVSDLVYDSLGTPNGVLIDVGGFLGIGGKTVRLQLAEVSEQRADQLGNIEFVTSYSTEEVLALEDEGLEIAPSDDEEGGGGVYGGGEPLATPEAIRAAIAEQARAARTIVEANTAMVKGVSYSVHLWVEHDGDVSEIERSLEATPAPTVFEGRNPVTTEAAASLSGEDFDIEALSPESQLTVPTSHWRWKVVPTSGGQKTLVVNLKHRVALRGSTYWANVGNFPQVIEVSVAPMERLMGGMEATEKFLTSLKGVLAALAGVVVLVAGWFVAKRKTGENS